MPPPCHHGATARACRANLRSGGARACRQNLSSKRRPIFFDAAPESLPCCKRKGVFEPAGSPFHQADGDRGDASPTLLAASQYSSALAPATG
ncbi:hypothetical protein C0Z20_04510 [Trinickia symbiotica]|uniref:Uncharacterized protein n=1 Tax=Trinickia symbiotica TaxID=863227 RepID=A0A2N7X8K4_9BURK|nr:hypothetical protein C0Z20_04510 [Trinickia symbiotica]